MDPIPEYNQELRPIRHRLDISDDEIVASLLKPQPITSEKNIWAFWDRGFELMPSWIRRGVVGWVRRLGPEWTVRVLDRVPGSPLNVSEYVSDEWFPEAFNDYTLSGRTHAAHLADLARLPLIYLYGGVWIDAGTILLRHVDDICWKGLENPDSPYELCGFTIDIRPHVSCMQNAFIAARKGNGFIQRWHMVYLELWRGRTSNQGVSKHPLISVLGPITGAAGLEDTPIKLPPEVSDYLGHFLAWERVTLVIDPSDGWNGPEYREKHMYLLDAKKETFLYQELTSWDGYEQLDLFTCPMGSNDQLALKAREFFQTLFSSTSTVKICHNAPTSTIELGKLLEKPENLDIDNQPGTFGAYFWQMSTQYDQTRVLKPEEVPPTPKDRILRKGVLQW